MDRRMIGHSTSSKQPFRIFEMMQEFSYQTITMVILSLFAYINAMCWLFMAPKGHLYGRLESGHIGRTKKICHVLSVLACLRASGRDDHFFLQPSVSLKLTIS